jgi:hypothetical protein
LTSCARIKDEEWLQAIMDQLMAQFNAPIGELAPNPTILSKDTQRLSLGSVHDQPNEWKEIYHEKISPYSK